MSTFGQAEQECRYEQLEANLQGLPASHHLHGPFSCISAFVWTIGACRLGGAVNDVKGLGEELYEVKERFFFAFSSDMVINKILLLPCSSRKSRDHTADGLVLSVLSTSQAAIMEVRV